YHKHDGLAADWVHRIYQDSDGRLWLGTTAGVTTFDERAAPGESQFRTYKAAQGLCDGAAQATREDRDGNIWVSTDCGIKKITHSGFLRFTQEDGLASLFVSGFFTSHNGELITITTTTGAGPAVHSVNRFEKSRFTSVTPRLPQGVSTGWGAGQILTQDQAGNWWLPGNKRAVYRFAGTNGSLQLVNANPQTIAIPDSEVFRIYEDLRGDVWISTMYDGHLLRWERATATIRDYRKEIAGTGAAACFTEDSAGSLWMGFDYGETQLAHYRDGRFQVISSEETKSASFTSLLFDHLGRLWFATKFRGVGRVDDPNQSHLQIVWYDRKKGLATDGAASLSEDKFGRIYVGHGRGVDRIDPNSGQIKHYTSADGLPQGAILFGARDAQGGLWFGSFGAGLARLVPEQDKPRQRPNILLTGLRVAGVAQSVSGLGETNLPALSLDSNQTHVGVDFLGLGASLGEELKYQYRLEGSNNDWVETSQRTVEFANLSPGSYRFAVRAVTFDNLVSQTPGTVSFRIAAPVWQRWWFIALVSLTAGVVGFALYRYRVSRLLELERVRTRIAADLHDDIGASLSRVAIMSEVVKQQVAGSPSVPMLTEIAESARELVGSMRDIVWAIDPRRDDLSNVVSRIREFASGMLETNGIKWTFETPSELTKIKLGPDARRHIFLFFKEAINNIVRHAKAGTVSLEIRVAHNQLIGEVRDDGQGFVPGETEISGNGHSGQGLGSMQRRVKQLRGTLAIKSSPGTGTELRLTIPLKRA
ncbi:MAG TPA: two-component regulator propeller domain-containing protein, partial [Pyrinomonadaceae bacterium]|nr:two-component regulator propeller domain-containing protein [Pyrinomonadaceae bacterium]